MNKIIEKTYELIYALENSDIINNLTISKEKVLLDSNLISLIEKAKDANNEELIKIKQELYKNIDYKNYIDNYNKLFYIILKINKNYKQITGTRSCKN